MKLLYTDGVNSFFGLEVQEWLLMNLQGRFRLGSVDVDSQTIFVVACWRLWKTRNEFVFQQKMVEVERTLSAIECYANFGQKVPKSRGKELVKWRSPSFGLVKINSDGVASKSEDWLAIRGIFKDSNGNWIERFQRYVERDSALNAELWAILQGLQLALTRNYGKIIVETDCSMALKIIHECLARVPSITIV